MLYNLQKDVSESTDLLESDKNVFKELFIHHTNWSNQMIDPLFDGLRDDMDYSEKNPNRFKRSN
ncbi:MAG: hypothetical protein IPL55_05325 [Saprospiraceae bacterium]|nr:hypothetical protein [Saprospiraceae bacterium]